MDSVIPQRMILHMAFRESDKSLSVLRLDKIYCNGLRTERYVIIIVIYLFNTIIYVTNYIYTHKCLLSYW